MKDGHLTLRIPGDLARALYRWARERGVPKSQLAREAVTRYLSPDPTSDLPARIVSATELAERWVHLPRLTPEEAAALAFDLDAAHRSLPDVDAPWG